MTKKVGCQETMFVETKYLGPTNHKPGRIKATSNNGNLTMSYRHDSGAYDNHCYAAKELATKHGYTKIVGVESTERGYRFCFATYNQPKEKEE